MAGVAKALNHMKNNNKGPEAIDSALIFSNSLIRMWAFFVRSINYGLQTDKLSTAQTQGRIKCIPRGQFLFFFNLKNWIPITLLNIAYKIASSRIGKESGTFSNTYNTTIQDS